MNHYIKNIIPSALVHPTYFIRNALSKAVEDYAPSLTGKILDVGCGTKPYQHFFEHTTGYIGMEYDTPEGRSMNGPDVFYDGDTFPFADNHFDSVIATEVLEHVFNPNDFLSEIHRVLKPGGFLLLTTPLMWKEHQQPYDYGRYSSFGLQHIVEKHDFKVVGQKKLVTGIRAIFLLGTRYLKECITVKNFYARTLLYVIFISPWTLLAIVLSYILPNKDSTYVGNALLAKKK